MRILAICLAAVGLASAAAAETLATETAVLGPAFRNTVVSTYPDGRQARLWLNPDRTFTGVGRHHDRCSGRWSLDGQKLCLYQSHPFVFGLAYCTRVPPGGVGTSWSARAATGETIRITVVKGGRS